MKKYRIDVYITDDHTLFNESLSQALNGSDTIRVSRTFTTLGDCRMALQEHRPDVLLLDISIPDGDGIAFCQWVMKEYPKVRVIAVTIHDEYSVVRRMMDTGVHGYLLKSSPIDELQQAIITVWKGVNYVSKEVEDIIRQGSKQEVVLTAVEKNILRHLCEGKTNPPIASLLNLSTETVSWYRKRLLAKYGVSNSVQLVSRVLKEKILE